MSLGIILPTLVLLFTGPVVADRVTLEAWSRRQPHLRLYELFALLWQYWLWAAFDKSVRQRTDSASVSRTHYRQLRDRGKDS